MGVSMKIEVLRESLNAVIGRGTDTPLCCPSHKSMLFFPLTKEAT